MGVKRILTLKNDFDNEKLYFSLVLDTGIHGDYVAVRMGNHQVCLYRSEIFKLLKFLLFAAEVTTDE